MVTSLSMVVAAIPALAALWIALAACMPSRLTAARTAEGRTQLFRRAALIGSVAALGVFACLAAVAAGGTSTPGWTSNGLGLSYGLLTVAVWPAVIFLGRQCDWHRPALLYVLLLLLESAFLALFATDDGMALCSSLIASSLIAYLLMSGWGGREGDRAGRKFLVFNLTAAMLLLIGVVGVAVSAARMSDATVGASHELSFSLSGLVHAIPQMATDEIDAQEYWNHARRWILIVLVLAAAIQTPLVPFHTWFTTAVAEAPLCVGMAMMGTGLRTGTYILARLVGPLQGDLGGAESFIMGWALVGALHTSLLALANDDMRKLASSVGLSQAALATAGYFALQPAGALVLSIESGLAAALLFFAFASLEIRFDAREMSLLGGLWRRLPQTSSLLLVAVLALVGAPGLGLFAGLFPTLVAVFSVSWIGTFLAIVSALITAWALFWMLERVVFGKMRLPQPLTGYAAASSGISELEGHAAAHSGSDHAAGIERPAALYPHELRAAGLLVTAPLLAGIILVGIHPEPFLDFVRSALALASFAP